MAPALGAPRHVAARDRKVKIEATTLGGDRRFDAPVVAAPAVGRGRFGEGKAKIA
jgi:hypothetical protein